MTEIVISKSSKKDKKYDARIDGRKTISFGAKGMGDYTITKDDEQKKRYLDRHRKNENPNDHNTASFYATNLLWNKKTLSESIKDTNSRFKNLKVKLK